MCWTREEGFLQKTRQRSSLLFGGQNLFNSFPRKLFFVWLVLTIAWYAPWWFEIKGWILPILPNPPRQNSQRGKELNKFFPPKQKRRLLPCLLYKSFCYGWNPVQFLVYCTVEQKRRDCIHLGEHSIQEEQWLYFKKKKFGGFLEGEVSAFFIYCMDTNLVKKYNFFTKLILI